MAYISYQLQIAKLNTPAAIIHYDKHARIEGLCSELVFQQQIAGKVGNLTTGYWISLHSGHYGITKFLPDTSHVLSDEDYIIMDHFCNKGLRVRIIYFDPYLLEFRKFHYKKGTRNIVYNVSSTEQCQIKDAFLIKEKFRNTNRLDLACNYLNNHVSLKHVAITRLFANHAMPGKAWDLDGFHVTDDSRIILFEVKHKFPATDKETQRKYFGLNIGQKEMLEQLYKLDIFTIHIILLKPAGSKEIPAVELLTDQDIYPYKWLFAYPDLENLELSDEPAPGETSYSGENDQKFYKIYLKDYIPLVAKAPDIKIKEMIYSLLPKIDRN